MTPTMNTLSPTNMPTTPSPIISAIIGEITQNPTPIQNDGRVQDEIATTQQGKTVSTSTQNAKASENDSGDEMIWIIVLLLGVAGICLAFGYFVALRHKNKQIDDLEKRVTTQMSRIDTLSKMQVENGQVTRNRVPTLSMSPNEVTLEESK